jgi:hypothetical protein
MHRKGVHEVGKTLVARREMHKWTDGINALRVNEELNETSPTSIARNEGFWAGARSVGLGIPPPDSAEIVGRVQSHRRLRSSAYLDDG